jgi:F1F0 ATPase subunit 2
MQPLIITRDPTMMNSLLVLVLAFSSGVLLGVIFFGGLWWTVRRGLLSSVPALWFPASSLIRTAVALEGFYVVSHAEWRRLLVCLLGFFLARLVVMNMSHKLAALAALPRSRRRREFEF